MDKTIRMIDFKNEFEAELFCKILDENNIPYYLKSIKDAAYNGLYQLTHGWGYLESSREYEEKIKSLYEKFKKAEIIDEECMRLTWIEEMGSKIF